MVCSKTDWVPAMGTHGGANPAGASLVLVEEELGTRAGGLAGSVSPLIMTPLKFKGRSGRNGREFTI